MKVVYARCAGLDVHKKSVHVCVRRGKGNTVQCETALFGTFTEDLHRLCAFLVRQSVSHCDGVHWSLLDSRVWNVLERSSRWKFDLVLVNPQHVRALPGRKPISRMPSGWRS